jgi:glycosyltransferase involved in cell wall biosynthesis
VARSLHVGLNALFLNPAGSGGTDTYLRCLTPALAEGFPELELTVFTTRRGATALREDGWRDFASVVHFPFDEGQRGRRLFAEQCAVVAAARRRRVDVLHSMATTGPALPQMRSVVTVHDVTFFRMQTFGWATTQAMKASLTGAVRTADVLIAVSAAARDDACAELGLDPDRFVVVPNGAGHPPAQPADLDAVRSRLDLDGRRLVLCVAAVRPHKNQRQLVEALAHLPDDVALVLAGAQELSGDEIEPLARRLGVEQRLRMTGFLPAAQLEALWRSASCAAFAKRAEGFGLPVLEAMRRRIPVACSNLLVLREVGGPVPHYFPLDDPVATARAILEAIDDPAAAARGEERAAHFTWANAARGTFAAYERALG